MNSNTKSILSRETIQMMMQKHFGNDVEVDKITELTDGWFNAVYILSFLGTGAGGYRELVLKTGVQESKYVLSYEKNIMQAEVFVYGLLEKSMIPVPKIVVQDFSRTLIDCDYFIMEKLPGENWMNADSQISAENQEKLIAQVAQYTAALHQIKGDYFGYIREDKEFQFPDWRSGFQGMVNRLIGDGRKDGVDLPYDVILETFEPLWPLLDEIKEPCLVNFDMWKKNIMLVKRDGEFQIDGIIDHERAFYGDPYADFISSNTICGDVEQHKAFQENYSQISGKPFTYTRNDKIRYYMYNIYLSLLMGVEVYRYDEEDTRNMLDRCMKRIADDLTALEAFLKQQ